MQIRKPLMPEGFNRHLISRIWQRESILSILYRNNTIPIENSSLNNPEWMSLLLSMKTFTQPKPRRGGNIIEKISLIGFQNPEGMILLCHPFGINVMLGNLCFYNNNIHSGLMGYSGIHFYNNITPSGFSFMNNCVIL